VEQLGGSCAIGDRRFHDEKNANFVAGEKVPRPDMGEYAEPLTPAQAMAKMREALEALRARDLPHPVEGDDDGSTQ